MSVKIALLSISRVFHCILGSNNQLTVCQPVVSDGAITVKFKSNHNDGSVKFKLLMEATEPNCPSEEPEEEMSSTCPTGPCCEGDDCCVLHLGTRDTGNSHGFYRIYRNKYRCPRYSRLTAVCPSFNKLNWGISCDNI